ncbi:hypothetical protein EV702DRAFT_1110626 [Suillus placidus]|uniref:Uncharacterized protein n=1 Tax=Suillus placidus TaxID=48579 RepID=A0A9P6ZUG2_9AGAM|nr:hypothetical protein EV702DRAFT_1110626 [Suillus placidus]
MRFSLLAVIAALTAVMSVSATPAVFSRECTADGGSCGQSSECCSGDCGYNFACGGMCWPASSQNSEELARRESESCFCLRIGVVVDGSIPSYLLSWSL